MSKLNAETIWRVRRYINQQITRVINMVEYPFEEKYEYKEYHFYVIFIDDECGISECMGKAYNGVTTSIQTIKTYIDTLEILYLAESSTPKYSYEIVEYDGTWNELLHYVNNTSLDMIDEGNWLEPAYVNWLGIDFVVTQHYLNIIDEMVYSYVEGVYSNDTHLAWRISMYECGSVLFGKYVNVIPQDVINLLHRLLNYYVPMAILSAIQDDEDYSCGNGFSSWLFDFCTAHNMPSRIVSYNDLYDYDYEIYLSILGEEFV